MYKKFNYPETTINRNTSMEGEPMEKQLQRMKNNNEYETMAKSMIYTRPEEGARYGTDIRGDKFDRALESTEKVTGHIRMTREEKYEARKKTLEEAKTKEKAPKKSENNGNSEGVGATPKSTD